MLAAFAVPSPMLFPAVREWVQDMPYATLPVFFAIGMAVQTAAVFCGAINVRSSHEFGTGPKLAFGALLLGAIVLALLTFALFGAAMR